VSEDDIKLWHQEFAARGVTPKYGVPGRIVFVDALPKTSVGKITKKVLRKQYAG
jgi:fatty-acyl-CoA synthase